MMDRMSEKHERKSVSARDARQGEIILRPRWRRIVFIAGLVGVIFLALILNLYWGFAG